MNLAFFAKNSYFTANNFSYRNKGKFCFFFRENKNSATRAGNVEYLEAADCRVLFQVDAGNLHNDDRLRHEKFDQVLVFFSPSDGNLLVLKLLYIATDHNILFVLVSGS